MKSAISLSLIILLSLLLESTITTLPLVLIVILLLFVQKKSSGVLILAFLLGLVLDLLKVQRVGTSSLFFTVFLFCVYLYERKYEINTFLFVLIASAVSSAGYALILNMQDVLLLVTISVLITGFAFMLTKILNK